MTKTTARETSLVEQMVLDKQQVCSQLSNCVGLIRYTILHRLYDPLFDRMIQLRFQSRNLWHDWHNNWQKSISCTGNAWQKTTVWLYSRSHRYHQISNWGVSLKQPGDQLYKWHVCANQNASCVLHRWYFWQDKLSMNHFINSHAATTICDQHVSIFKSQSQSPSDLRIAALNVWGQVYNEINAQLKTQIAEYFYFYGKFWKLVPMTTSSVKEMIYDNFLESVNLAVDLAEEQHGRLEHMDDLVDQCKVLREQLA